jgi:hypothetical protein
MTKPMFLRALFLLALSLAVAWAADVSGQWKAEYASPDGQTRQSTFTFKVDGEKLTGTVASAMGESQISEGKVSGDEIKLAVTANFGGEERTFEMTAKRAK